MKSLFIPVTVFAVTDYINLQSNCYATVKRNRQPYDLTLTYFQGKVFVSKWLVK